MIIEAITVANVATATAAAAVATHIKHTAYGEREKKGYSIILNV